MKNIKSRFENSVLNIDIPKQKVKEEEMKTVDIK